ncbi:MAG TPA: hypothetical protein DCR69_03590, partial [Clostridium sp.]|nr:hypothetical protein [Clostridium sp.]
MTCVGSLLIISLALNIMKISKIKVIYYVPAIFYQLLFVCLCNYLVVFRNRFLQLINLLRY